MSIAEERLRKRIDSLELELKELNEKCSGRIVEKYYRSLVENSNDMIYYYSRKTGYAYVSPSSSTITGYSPEEWYEAPNLLAKIVHPDFISETEANWKMLMKGVEQAPLEYKIFTKTNEQRFVRQRSIIIKNEKNRVIGIEGDVADVTEIKKSEENLKKLMMRLSRSNEDLDEFATAVSHDLQEPLMIIANFSQILMNDYLDKLDDKGKDFLRYVSDGANHMKGLLDGLLAYSRSTVGRHYRKTVSIKSIVSTALKNLEVLIKKSNVGITLNLPDEMITCDPYQMARAIQNVISNSIKFCDKNFPLIKVEAVLEDNAWTVTISDNGIGIDDENLDKIFTIFHREHNNGEFEGAGVGLAMFKKIIERHGGTISVSSTKGLGSTFSFTLPN